MSASVETVGALIVRVIPYLNRHKVMRLDKKQKRELRKRTGIKIVRDIEAICNSNELFLRNINSSHIQVIGTVVVNIYPTTNSFYVKGLMKKKKEIRDYVDIVALAKLPKETVEYLSSN